MKDEKKDYSSVDASGTAGVTNCQAAICGNCNKHWQVCRCNEEAHGKHEAFPDLDQNGFPEIDVETQIFVQDSDCRFCNGKGCIKCSAKFNHDI